MQAPKAKKAEPPPEEAEETAPAAAEPQEGEGEFRFSDGSVYVGKWVRNEAGIVVRQGRGVLSHPVLGYKYVGEWVADAMSGFGAFRSVPASPRASRCTLSWLMPAFTRTPSVRRAGEFTYASGAKYAGQWADNRYSGHGRYVFPDGGVYEGTWVDNQMHGNGVYVDTKNVPWKGQFYNGTGPGLHALVV